MKTFIRTWAVGCILIIAFFALTACGGDEEGESQGTEGGTGKQAAQGARGKPGAGGEKAAVPVRTQAVEQGEIVAYISTFERLEAERWVDVVARTAGMATDLHIEEGDSVAAGDILLQLDKDQLTLHLKQVEVALEQARATFERTKTLFERNLVSAEEYDSAKHQLQNNQLALEEAQLNLTYADIRAPIAGMVMQRSVEVGDMVQNNQQVLAIADLNPLLVSMRIPEKRIHQVRPGQEARLFIDALPGQSFVGEVRMINPGVDPQSGTVKVTLEVPPGQGALKPGMFAQVQIIIERHAQALLIPKKALILETDEDDVFVLVDGKAERRPIELGFAEGNHVEVLTGLVAADQVITVGQEGLKDGAAVRQVGQQTP